QDPKAEQVRRDNLVAAGTVYILFTFVAHALHAALRVKVREHEPLLPDVEGIDKRTALGLSAIVVVLGAMLSIGCYYTLASRPLGVSKHFLLMLTAALFLLFTHLLDVIRAFTTADSVRNRGSDGGLLLGPAHSSLLFRHFGRCQSTLLSLLLYDNSQHNKFGGYTGE
ncbi:hypothetical protein PENTCL1PPCAC_19336, partial [Pristionchus entomophagus]